MGADLGDMLLISNFDKVTRFLLRVIYIFSKYGCIVPLKDKKGITIVNTFQNIPDNSIKLNEKTK